MTKPGVQKPHCEPWHSTIACWTGCSEPSGCAQVLDRDQLLAVQLRQEQDAGVERAVAQALAVRLAEHHGAGAAIAFGAALLGAGPALHLTQIVQHREVRVDLAQRARLVAEEETDRLGHQLPR